MHAGVAEWQTRRSQKPVRATSCGFDSHPRHTSYIISGMDSTLLNLFTILSTGFVLGLHHALDADHVVAVSTIVSKTKSLKSSSIFGALWGAGHTTTLFLIGVLILFFKLSIPRNVALFFEFSVGLMLVIMGGQLLYRTSLLKKHIHIHEHDGHAHKHPHAHDIAHNHHQRSFLIGMVHGLAGSAALMILVLSTVKSALVGALFILIFGLGSIAGMFVTSALVGLPFVLSSRFDRLHELLTIIAAVAGIFVGLSILYEIGVVEHLFF